jgi:hypothetical protein
VRAKFGPPDAEFLKEQDSLLKYYQDRPYEAEFPERDSRLRPPVVKQVWHGWKPIPGPVPQPRVRPVPVKFQSCILVGYDAKGIARAFRGQGWGEGLGSDRRQLPTRGY